MLSWCQRLNSPVMPDLMDSVILLGSPFETAAGTSGESTVAITCKDHDDRRFVRRDEGHSHRQVALAVLQRKELLKCFDDLYRQIALALLRQQLVPSAFNLQQRMPPWDPLEG